MKLYKTILRVSVFVILFVSGIFSLSAGRKVKNIIFMVPDGMGISNVTAARVYAYGVGKRRLYLETLEQIGYQSTYSENSMLTDSAAAASAWACGQKFKNKEISYHNNTNKSPKTILELAKEMGKSAGLVATSTITDATPAAFGAHVGKRSCENEIARQYIERIGVDVLLGGGRGVFNASEKNKDPCGTYGNFIQTAEEKGYKVVFTREAMLASTNERKLLGLFHYKSLTPSYRRDFVKKVREEPSLSEMTRIALKILEKNDKGFFLIVEGSQIDWANHDNNLEYQINEILEFDKAVKQILNWLNLDKSRKESTLIIIVPDHDCGGFAIKGPKDKTFTKPGQYVEAGWVWGSHTGEDTIIWSQGPYSEHLGRAIDNTDIFYIMKAALLGKPYKKVNLCD